MFGGFQCSIPAEADRKVDKINNIFIETVMEQERRVKDLKAQEVQMTAENPGVRAQQEIPDISIELKAQKVEDFLNKKRRQQLRQNNLELRQLEKQLKAAFISKELVEQKEAADKLKEEQMKSKRLEDIEFEKEQLRCKEALIESERKEWKKKEEFRSVLLSQMAESQQKRKDEYTEVLKDRDLMQKLLHKYKTEHDSELMELERRKESAKKEMDEFKRKQEEYKLMQMSQKIDEVERFQEMMKEREEKNLQLKLQREKQTQKRAELSDRIGQELYKVESEKRRRENLLLDLLVEERNTNEDMRYKQNLEKQHNDRIQMRMEFERYRKERERQKLEREQNEDATFLAEMRKQLAERDKIDQLADEKRRQKIREHGRAIQEMIELRRRQRAADAAEEIKWHEFLNKEERKRLELVENERMEMLKNAPVDVLRYLPSGVLKDMDRKVLGLSDES
ncbi:PREDICTED: meiosis-specific nuclear structural protein 1-like [Rhagoletis zephyria]|uniref:meiosis-specific nuclear structural protein 1-like n=1 Tax=Rhagoletis zephyria TaxID=28612 RepID=UPI000811994E|nr:PREDICTED: meiosis-specific nuclear structural protein 1-like [Rhagoletis zephyria]